MVTSGGVEGKDSYSSPYEAKGQAKTQWNFVALKEEK